MYTLPTGSNAEFTCLALANDVDNLDFIYRRIDGGLVPNNVVRTSHDAATIVGRTTMRITGVTQANAGEYQCLVRNVNTQGDAIALGNRNFTIQVSGKSVINDLWDYYIINKTSWLQKRARPIRSSIYKRPKTLISSKAKKLYYSIVHRASSQL